MTGNTKTPTVTELHRFSVESYEQLAGKMPPIAVTNETTERQMGFQLGIQYVLEKLRKGYVVGA